MEIAEMIRGLAIAAPAILIAITFHEVAHGYVAYKLGDTTAKAMGRLTLNPLAHIDIFGTIIIPLLMYVMTGGRFVYGYAKPVPINPRNFKDPRKGMMLSAAGGPLSNLLLAVVSVLIFKYIFPLFVSADSMSVGAIADPVARMLTASVMFNVVLAVFNMIPIPPLDGGRVLAGLLPYRHAVTLERLEPYGIIIVMLLVVTKIANIFLYPVMQVILELLNLL